VLVLPACSSSKPGATTTGPLDASVDGGLPPQGDASMPPIVDSGHDAHPGDENPPATACTAPPFVNFGATVSVVDLSVNVQPLSGVKVGFSSCPGYYVTTDSNGAASTQITQGIAVTPLFDDGTTIVGSIGAEIPATSDVALKVTLFAGPVAAAIPSFIDAGSPATLAVALEPDLAATAPCNDVTGVTLSVTGHPEAVVTYAGPGWPANTNFSKASSTGTYAFIQGITGASSVGVTGTKSGCTVQFASAAQTGKFAVLSGTVTVGGATVTN
jgi:hypothetical protein